MDRLRSADIDILADAVHAIGEVRTLDEFHTHVLGQMRRLVDCDVAAYNEVGPTPETVVVFADPPESLNAEMLERFAAHAHQNPLVAHHASHPTAPAVRLSDFIGRRQLHGLELYHLVYRPLGTEYQAAMTVSAADRVVGLSVSRAKPDFTDSELRRLDAMRPFLMTTLRDLRTRGRIEATLAALGHARGVPAAILFVSERGRIEAADERADRWLGSPSTARTELELQLEGWARESAAAGCEVGPDPRPHAYRIDHPRGPHRVRYVHGDAARPAAILIETTGAGPRAADLTGLGLTRRQGEVLQLVGLGSTNSEIAKLLGLSERTVAHHLEHIYDRLGVSTRTAAAHRANEHLLGCAQQRTATADVSGPRSPVTPLLS